MFSTIKTYFTCLTCKRFKSCHRRFCRDNTEIFTKWEIIDGIVCLSNPEKCENPELS